MKEKPEDEPMNSERQITSEERLSHRAEFEEYLKEQQNQPEVNLILNNYEFNNYFTLRNSEASGSYAASRSSMRSNENEMISRLVNRKTFR